MMYNLNRGHPFIDGNKRTSLFATYFFLRWNGYYLDIPDKDAPLITQIADRKNHDITISDAYEWILSRTKCTPKTILYHLSVYVLIRLARIVKDPDFSHIVSSWMFISPPAFIKTAIKERPNGNSLSGHNEHDP